MIAFDRGVDDEGLLDDNHEMHTLMERLGLPHHYAEHPGGHTWTYWDEHMREALAQHVRVLCQRLLAGGRAVAGAGHQYQ